MPGYEWFGQEERNEVNEVLNHGVLMRYGFDGPRNGSFKAKELEAAICQTFGCQHAHVLSSGTAALTTAMAALGIGYGDEVIMPSFTFVASFEAVLSVGAIPVLADVDDTLTLEPGSVRSKITARTKAIMPVHMCGSMADLDALQAIAREHNLILLEDACQSIGGTYKGRHLGTIGHAGTFSFDYVKTITCGEGGVVMTNDAELWRKADHYTDHGHDHKGVDRGADLHPFIGYNFRLGEMNAAVGLAQIRKLDRILEVQRRNNQLLRQELVNIEGISFRRVPDPAGDNGAFLTWFLPTEALTRAAVQALREAGQLAGSFYWFDNNWHYIRKWDHLKNAESLNRYSAEQISGLKALQTQDFSASDAIMGRAVSTSISLNWTPEQIALKGKAMRTVLEGVLEAATV